MFQELERDFDFSKYRNYKKEKQKQKYEKIFNAVVMSSIGFLFCILTAQAFKNPQILSKMNDGQDFGIVLPVNETLSEKTPEKIQVIEKQVNKSNTKTKKHKVKTQNES